MFLLVAPTLKPETTTVLPNPQFSDTKGLRADLQTYRTIDGTLYTYVKTKNKKHAYLWDFALTRNKGLELLEFYKVYAAEKITCILNDEIIVGYIKNNPFESATIASAHGMPGNEMVKMTIEFEEA